MDNMTWARCAVQQLLQRLARRIESDRRVAEHVKVAEERARAARNL